MPTTDRSVRVWLRDAAGGFLIVLVAAGLASGVLLWRLQDTVAVATQGQSRDLAASVGRSLGRQFIRAGQLVTAMRHADRGLEIAELAVRHRERGVVGFDIAGAEEYFNRGCDLGVATACGNVVTLRERKGEFAASRPGLNDFPVILQGSKGEIREEDPDVLYALACRQGWTGACRK